VNVLARSEKSGAATAALIEAEVNDAIATCGGDVRAALRATLIASAYLEGEIERLTGAISTGFARGRIPQGTSAGEEVDVAGIVKEQRTQL
jgi:hypothetical protein